jgi:hypothetical protein
MLNENEEQNFAEQLAKTCILLSKIRELKEGIQGNEYETFLNGHLVSVEVELKRQLTNIDYAAKLKE